MLLPGMCGSSLLLSLPDDIFSVITRSLSPRDISSLGLSCRGLHAVVASDKVWLAQCDKLGLIPCNTLVEWRNGVCSYKALCRFLVNISPLTGIWVHQNPELGNVVYVMPGFLSIVGCRIIPQEVGPLGLDEGPILWTPVFEILCDHEGSAQFFLHGSERGADYVYPGMLKSVDINCNVLLLEAEPRHHKHRGKLSYSKSLAHDVVNNYRLPSLDSGISKSSSQRVVGQKSIGTTFNRLGFGDRRRLLDVVTSQVRQVIPDTVNSVLIPRSRNNEFDPKQDFTGFYERRLLLLQMFNGDKRDVKACALGLSEVCKSHNSKPGDGDPARCTKSKTLSGLLKNGLKQILGTSSSAHGNRESSSQKNGLGCESKHVQLHEFLKSGDTIRLSLRAVTMKLSSYRAWPNMHDSRFALYKLPIRAPKSDHEYAGLWGGTFGWPPGNPSEDKPGKALFLILISYEESEDQQLLIATKILEGTSYVLHPNGSAMFMVNVGQPSLDTFPWGGDKECDDRVDVRESFVGEGIANGYGFRYPGSKPGTLFVVENGLLVFVWKESRAALTLQRLDLADLLRKGERVPCLSPVSNFAYLTKTYSNVFSGFSNSTNSMASPSAAVKQRALSLTRGFAVEISMFCSILKGFDYDDLQNKAA
ncbi:hypothetical protein CASFOL_015437 [Castilleja foliolosa]|uniref:F-box domain-containing protein n=1 Tax=Castilleja foliolosa TaxID=1961234 RepID=A0ABD3DF42_9LAMI